MTKENHNQELDMNILGVIKTEETLGHYIAGMMIERSKIKVEKKWKNNIKRRTRYKNKINKYVQRKHTIYGKIYTRNSIQ